MGKIADDFVNDKNIIYSQSEWDRNKVEWLWEDDYYDGPLSGMIEYNGKRYYAHWFDDMKREYVDPETDEEKEYTFRVYCVYKLTEKRQEHQEYWRWLFELLVEKIGYSPNNPICQFFYGRYKADYQPFDLRSGRDGEVVGWFID